MAGRPRKPLSLAKIEGRDKVNAGRYKKRNEPTGTEELGDPPDYLVDRDENKARTAWKQFAVEIPWLNTSHRALLEIASMIRGEIIAGGFPGIQKVAALKQMLSAMGATPADATKVGAGKKDDDGEDEDENRILNGG